MKYYEIKIEVSELGIEPMLAALISEGIDTAEVNDPADALFMDNQLGETDYLAPEDFDKESNKNPSIVVYAAADEEADNTINAVKKAVKIVRDNVEKGFFGTCADLGSLEVTLNIRDDEEWKDRWKEFLKPALLGYSYVATPPWIDMSEYAHEFDDREVIRINPGMAFGTGLHETTSLSADFLETYIQEGDKVLDVGCGGGILSHSMALRGATVTGIDLGEENIAAAKIHAEKTNQTIDFQCISVEELAKTHAGQFDVVTCMEMLEHVPNPQSIINACFELLKPNGVLVLSTINRNAKAYLFAIIGAEYVLKLLDKGTHDYNKFITPAELDRFAERSGFKRQDLIGLHYNPITKNYWLAQNVDVNYMMAVFKP